MSREDGIATVGADGVFLFSGQRYRAAIGRAGVRAEKAEGDGATPAGLLLLRRVLYRADRVAIPRTMAPREPIAPNDGWCDDPADPAYNRMITLPHSVRHEELWRADGLYDIIGVLGWNDDPPRPGRGSAIFLHVATADFAPTAGCIALALADLRAVLAAGLRGVAVLPG